MSRRAAGEGSVHRSPDGSGWVAMIELPRQADGRRRRRKRRATTRAEAQKLLREMRDEIAQTGTVSGVQRTVKDGVESYLVIRASGVLSEGAREDDSWLSGILLDGLGGRRLAELTVVECDEFLTKAAAGLNGRRPISRDRLARLGRFLVAVLRNEMRKGSLARNIAELSVLPATEAEATDRRALESGELRQLLTAARGSRLVLVDLCARNGLRPAEARLKAWRHTAISRQADAGASAWEIADWAGTSEAMISRIYRHRLRRVSSLRPLEDS